MLVIDLSQMAYRAGSIMTNATRKTLIDVYGTLVRAGWGEPDDQGTEPTSPDHSCTAGRIRGRTIYLPDDLFERILVQAHRHDRTISEYVAGILERQVPDHRIARAEPVGESGEAGAA
jgi:hypothetical protein